MRALAVLAIAASAFAQDAPKPDVKALVARIDGKNAEACFDAISRIVDLPASERSAIEAAAAAMPDDLAYYRTALLDELKVRDKLGERYPREARVSIDAKDKGPADVLRDLLTQAKEQVESGWAFQGGAQNPITLKLDDVPYLTALRALCKEAQLRVYSQAGGLTLYRGGGEGGPSFQFRTQLMTMDSIQRTRRVVFGAGEKRTLNLQAGMICDSRSGVVSVGKPTNVEAIDDKGRKVDLQPDDKDKEDALADETDYVSNANAYFTVHIPLVPPEKGVEKLARVRGSVPLQVPQATSKFVFPHDKLDKQSDEHFEVSVEPSQSMHRQLSTTVRIKPKGALKAFIAMPVQIRMKAKEGAERPCYASGRSTGDAIEYSVQRYASAEEQMQGRNPELETVTVLIHRETAERRMWFEFRDIPVE